MLAKVAKLVTLASVPAWRNALFRYRVAAGVEHSGMFRSVGDLHTVVDVGANRGQFALAARRWCPRARIISFEPLAAPAQTYRTVFGHDESVTLRQAAIGPRREERVIHVAARDDSSSLLPISPVQSELFPGTFEVRGEPVAMAPLFDHMSFDAIRSPALLKLDVQGFELQALEGCESGLSLFAWIYVECSFVELYEGQAFADTVIAWLRSRGFTLRGTFNTSYDAGGRPIQADFLFRRVEPHRAMLQAS